MCFIFFQYGNKTNRLTAPHRLSRATTDQQRYERPNLQTKTEYEIIFRVDLGKAIPGVNELMERLNTGMSSVGWDEKLTLTHDGMIPPMTLTADRELTTGEQETMMNTILGKVCEHFPKYDVRVSAFRRKSGNVQQSVA